MVVKFAHHPVSATALTSMQVSVVEPRMTIAARTGSPSGELPLYGAHVCSKPRGDDDQAQLSVWLRCLEGPTHDQEHLCPLHSRPRSAGYQKRSLVYRAAPSG